jgi:ribonuclease J
MVENKLRLIPLGGLGEVGKNMMLLEHGDDIIAIDAGLMFPEEEMLGVDLVIPDISYLVERSERLRGIIITHGHEDHCGALPYILPRVKAPIYSTPLTKGFISLKLKEYKLLGSTELRELNPGETITLGCFRVEFLHVCHSIPDAVGLIIHTPIGIVVHSGDFKVDHSPVDGRPTDFPRLAEMGGEKVLLLLSDSTYVEIPGYTPSEKVVGETLEHIMAEASGRVIIATFSSLVARIQQVLDAAARYRRSVFVVGRSMVDTVRMASQLGYLSIPEGTLAPIDELRKLPREKVVILTTGSQGEPTSALVRMANSDHHHVQIYPGDTVVMSATAIPGNEALVNRTVDNLFRLGARVLYDKIAQVHVHGHGSQEELKLLLNLVRPKFFVPIHGEYRHLQLHAHLANSLGLPESHAFVLEDGDVLELSEKEGRVVERLGAGNVYVDGLSVGDVDSLVLRDRKLLARDGIVIVVVAIDKLKGKLIGRPDILSRGFVDARESETLFEASRDVVAKALDHREDHPMELSFINSKVKESLTPFFHQQTGRRPMILPMTVEV